MLRTEVIIASYLTTDHLPIGGPHEDVDLDEAHRVYDEAEPIAIELTRRYIQHVRVRFRQSWLGSSAWTPSGVWNTEMRDASGHRLAVSYSRMGTVVLQFCEDALTIADQQEAISNASRGIDPPLAESLLADARFVNWPTGNSDRRQGVLLAAIACEVKIKQRLRELAHSEQQGLLALILDNPRDVTIAVSSLLDTTLDAVCGRSLRRDDKNLYKAAVSLFEDRNTVAHRGGVGLDPGQLGKHFQTAQSLFSYLDSIGIST